ncbi:molecular chaperone Tir [Bacillus toyonensis]|uniref:TIR domain-containing protein n=1 Tax=Bacillus toyonensis TaxID=155322 RepID=UPI002701D7A9|nr:TIR domain-containing protein [Bacillus toyonensis]MDO8160456.1 molecular chaperone Tir [Bacillus toyonensis]
MSGKYNLFISHSWAYNNEYEGLLELLNKDEGFIYKNYSVPKDDPIHNANNDKELREAIKRQMSSCHVVIILAGVYASYSKWIDEEIQLAKTGFLFPKKIIAVERFGSQRTSKKVKDNADVIVKWNSKSLIKAIKGEL